jgi:hypothetical protein
MTLPAGLQFNDVSVDSNGDLFPPTAMFLGGRPNGIAIAHWFLILLFLIPWSGWLTWRWRQIKGLDASQ